MTVSWVVMYWLNCPEYSFRDSPDFKLKIANSYKLRIGSVAYYCMWILNKGLQASVKSCHVAYYFLNNCVVLKLRLFQQSIVNI